MSVLRELRKCTMEGLAGVSENDKFENRWDAPHIPQNGANGNVVNTSFVVSYII